jgi:hypothetical protein
MNNAIATIPTNALEELRRKAAAVASIEPWHPQPGDILEGRIEVARKAEGPFGVQEQLLVRTPDGHLVAVWLGRWLLGQLRANGAELGDLVSLTFHGKETGRTGATLNRLTLVTLPGEQGECRADAALTTTYPALQTTGVFQCPA